MLLVSLVALCACSPTQVRYRPMTTPPPQASALDAVVYLVGDAGDPSPGREAVLGHLGADLARIRRQRPGTPAVVVFLGDNIYEVGAREAFRAEDLAKLDAQAGVIDSLPGTRALFLPGNHDWAKGAGDASARTSIRRQQEWLTEMAPDGRALLLPGDGCPGPEVVRVGGNVNLLFIDTEWLLRLPEDDCGGEAAFYARLSAALAELRDERVVVAAHHPLASGGPHGGNVAPLARGPFVYYLSVKSGLGVQDLASGRYARMIRGLRSAVEASGSEPIAFAAGHDHTLQVIQMNRQGAPRFQLVSGSGSKRSPVARTDGTRYASGEHGYMRIDFMPDGTRVVVYADGGEGSGLRPVFTCALGTVDRRPDCPEASLGGGGT